MELKDGVIHNKVTPCYGRGYSDDTLWLRAELEPDMQEYARGKFTFDCDISDALKFYFDDDKDKTPAKKITIILRNPWKNLKLYDMDVVFEIEGE